MKFNRHPKVARRHDEPLADEPLAVVDAQTYARLTSAEKSLYRPVDPRRERLPLASVILYGIAGFFLIIYIIQLCSPSFSDFFNRCISSVGRTVLSALTAWIPFSVGEAVIWLLPLGLVSVLIYAVRHWCDTWCSTMVFVGILLSVVASLFSLFVLNFSAGYRGTTLDQKLGLTRTEVSAQELYDTSLILIEHINSEAGEIYFHDKDFSVMPYSLREMNEKLNRAYEQFCTAGDDLNHDFITHTPSYVKPVLASEVMSHMHITGIYSFFTGEANINVAFPDYTIPFTAAHEMAHQRGIAREDEANFIAYLVCIGSDDPYIRYSGYLNMYEYVSNALYRADTDLYSEARGGLNYAVQYEMLAYNEFFKQYQGSTISQVSQTVNNAYLQMQGTPGTQSYGMVVDLAVAYYRSGHD